MIRSGRVEPTPPECALAAEMFDHFCSAGTMKQILALHREICNTLTLKPNRLPDFYPKLKAKLVRSWKAQALFKKFDARANHKVYGKGRACASCKVLIIGAGPCGLRAAIECQLLGAKVVVIEKRDRISRNNVLHLWPFVIHDLRALGAKKFFGKFCAGSIDHISIRQLQCILLKVALLLGVEFHEGVSFDELLEPTETKNSETLGWRARVTPSDHPVSLYEFDVLLGADGKRNTLQGFKRKEFRGKLAMAITANFINRHTEQEASVPEISGVAFIFNQKFFKDLNEETGIDLENIVYYKDDTHYFVMTAKKHSLLDKGVLLNDYTEVSRLLSVENVDRIALMRYAQEAARFSTDGRLPLKDFALNHYGEPDIALFDFTSMYAAENASMVYERHGRRVLCQLVGDSLLEPFWPTGSGCARGFLSAMDASWAVRSWGQNPMPHPLEVIAERESIYRLLAQTTPENLHRDFGAYILDPGTRYPNLNRKTVSPHRVVVFYNSDEPLPLDATMSARKRRRELDVSDEVLIAWVGSSEDGLRGAASPTAMSNLLLRYRPDLLPTNSPEVPIYHVLHQEFGITPFSTSGSLRDVPDSKLRSYLSRVYNAFKGEVPHVYHETDVFDQIKSQQRDKYLARNSPAEYPVAVLHTNSPNTDKSHTGCRKKRRALKTQEERKTIGVATRMCSGGGERVARLAAELSGTNAAQNMNIPRNTFKPKDLMRSVGRIEKEDWNMKVIEKKILENRLGRPEPKTVEKVPKWDREQFLGRQRRLKEGEGSEKWVEIDENLHKLDQKLRDSGRPDLGTKKVANLATKFVKQDEPELNQKPTKEEVKKSWRGPLSTGMQCAACGTRVFAAEGVTADGLHLHRACFRCAVCKTVLRPGNYAMEPCGKRLVCLRHSRMSVLDAASIGKALNLPQPNRVQQITATPERISVELSDSCAKEIDEDEWTDRNFLASETSCAGGLSDEEESSSDDYTDANGSDNEPKEFPDKQEDEKPRVGEVIYISDDSFGYDDYSDDGVESSGNESCSRMRAAREARRREVPADTRPDRPTDSSEVESEEESESSDEEVSSATEVSTDSEFGHEESAPVPLPPAILVTEAAPVPPPPTQDYPLSRTRSAGGLATKRALELKRKYLLGEPSPPAVRKSESTSQMDTKFEAFRSTISEFQKLLHPAPMPTKATAQKPIVTFQLPEDVKPQPMPDIIKNLCNDVSIGLLTNGDSPPRKDWNSEPTKKEEQVLDVESDSLSDDSSHTEIALNQTVPRVEVHNEGGELIQLDSLTIITTSTEDNDKGSGTVTVTDLTIVAAESESSDSCRDATTLALTETELSDWAAESVILDDIGFEVKEKKRNKNPRQLSGPKLIHDEKIVSPLASHVCGRTSPSEKVVYSNAAEHFEFADEGEQDPTIEKPVTPKNLGFMELVDDDYAYSPSNDRSMNFIEKSYSETVLKSASQDVSVHQEDNISEKMIEPIIKPVAPCDYNKRIISVTVNNKVSDKTTTLATDSIENDISNVLNLDDLNLIKKSPIIKVDKKGSTDNITSPLEPATMKSPNITIPNRNMSYSENISLRIYAPAICRSASETFHKSNSKIVETPLRNVKSPTEKRHSEFVKPASSEISRDMTNKVQEIKREREEQTELVRRLVLERLGNGSSRASKKSSRRTRVSPACTIPPPVPPLPNLPDPVPTPQSVPTVPCLPCTTSEQCVPPPRPTPPHISMQVTASLSDPELTRERRRKSIVKSFTNYLSKHIGPRHKDPREKISKSHKSTGALQEPPPVPPPPVHYRPPQETSMEFSLTRPGPSNGGACDVDERDAMQLWFEARWARLVNQRRLREEQHDNEPSSKRLARLERRLSRPLSAEQQASTVAELVQVSAQREAHSVLMAADRKRCKGQHCRHLTE